MNELKIGDTVPLEIPPKYIPDQQFWEGFEACLEMILNYIYHGGFFKSDEDEIADCFADAIIREADYYKVIKANNK